MNDIADFVVARIAEDEAIVRGAAARPEPGRDLWISEWPPEGSLGVSRARMRVELEAKRRLVEWADATGSDHVLRVLAMVHDDHPDWRPEWTVVESPQNDHSVSGRRPERNA